MNYTEHKVKKSREKHSDTTCTNIIDTIWEKGKKPYYLTETYTNSLDNNLLHMNSVFKFIMQSTITWLNLINIWPRQPFIIADNDLVSVAHDEAKKKKEGKCCSSNQLS